jgi:hypothetical protein
MTNALDPASPLTGDQVEIVSELHGIKTRLVADKANIEDLQADIAPLNGAGAKGLQLLDANDTAAARTVLEIEAAALPILDAADLAAIKTYLGIAAQTLVSFAGTTARGHISIPGGLIINYETLTIPSGGVSVTWHQEFPTALLFAGGILLSLADHGLCISGAPSTVNAYFDHNNASAHDAFVFAVGK